MIAAPSTALAVVRPAGAVPWAEGLRLQREAHAARVAGHGPDTLLLLEHSPVVTLGPRTAPGDLRVDAGTLAAHGVEVAETDRGGGITFHGPGQVVAYPVLDLRARGMRPRDYLRYLETLVIDVLDGFGLAGRTVEGRTGVWIGNAKICAMGVRISRGVSLHGLALNVATDLRGFDAIVPCGIADAAVTSMDRLLDRPPTVEAVKDALERAFRAAPGAPWRLP